MALIDGTLWRRLSPELDQSLELSPAERTEFLESLRAYEPALAAELARLLHEHDLAVASGFLASPPTPAAASLGGQELGPYTLVERLGSGGMGSVWRARRSDGRFEGEVAVKLLHPSLFDGHAAERFRSEGTILSRLAHPGIARLFDAGLSATGQPFLVLELVEGERLDRYADSMRFSVRERLDLFLQVCEAVAHAHANLVVHRDLKPSNILVDRDGRVKLLDFGIATLLDAASGEARGRTVTAARALTPEYAAPEQLEGEPVTTATDVYALGVLLYELLTGEHPIAKSDTSPAGLVRAITSGTAPRMSERVRRHAAGPDSAGTPELFAERSTTPERLGRALAGDLDTIVAKALKKVPAERYATVAALADDVQRHLQDLPVKARRDSFGYRARKLVARHRIEVAAAAVAVVALVASTAIAWRQARASAAERDRALAELERAEITNDFSVFLLSEANPGESGPSKPELLQRGEAMIEKRFSRSPDLHAHMLLVLSGRYYETFDFANWERVLLHAFEISQTSRDPRLRSTVGCAHAIAVAEHDAERATHLLHEAISRLESLEDAGAELAGCKVAESIVAYRRGDYEHSRTTAASALALQRARHGPAGREIEALNVFANAAAILGRFTEATKAYAELFALVESQGLAQTKNAAIYRNNWAVALQGAGQIRRAVIESESAVAAARVADPGRGAPPSALWTYASALTLSGHHREALPHADEALEKARTAGSPADLFWALTTAARTRAEAGQGVEARQLLNELERLVAANPDFPGWMLAAQDRIRAMVALALGDAPAGLAAARHAVERLIAEKRPERELLSPLLVQARAENDNRDFVAALASAQRAVPLATSRRGDLPHSRETGLAELELARAKAGAGEPAAARIHLAGALENLRSAVGIDAPETRRAELLGASIAD